MPFFKNTPTDQDRAVGIEFAKRNKVNPAWRAFKSRWDGRIPRRGTKAFVEYTEDAVKVERCQTALLKQIRWEFNQEEK
jgi:hypothetical protein